MYLCLLKLLRSNFTLVTMIICGTRVVSFNAISLLGEMAGLKCGSRKVQGGPRACNYTRNEEDSKIDSVMPKNTGASSEELPMAKIVTICIRG